MAATRPRMKIASVINRKYFVSWKRILKAGGEGKWFPQAFRKLGEGGCGVIYEVAMVKSPGRRFACKAETTVPDEDPTLPMEHKVISLLNDRNSIHCVELIEKGTSDNYQFLVMTLLGPSLDVIKSTLPTQKFSSFSTLVVVIQALDSLSEIHEIGYIHRDVKPANFAIGALGTPKQRLLHVLDFGIARQYLVKDGAEGEFRIRKPRRIVPFRGTLRYCSMDAQDRKEQGRHDDLWSLFYMLVEFVKGSLPWAGITEEEKVMAMKKDTTELFNGLEPEFVIFARHLSVLRYKSKPDYGLLRDLLSNVFIRKKFNPQMKVDWEKGGLYDSHFEKKTSTLPTVTEKDMTEVDLAQVLMIPEKERKICEEEVCAAGNLTDDDGVLNTAQDDTIIEGEVNTKESKRIPVVDMSKKSKRRYVTRTPSVHKVEVIEYNWKKKQEAEKKEKLVKHAEAERRAKQDFIVPDETTVAKKKGGRMRESQQKGHSRSSEKRTN